MKKWVERILLLLFICFVMIWIIRFINERKALPPMEERVYGVSQIWKQASDFYALWDLTDEDLDWDQAYETAYREAVSARTARDYYLALKKFLANLHDGHADGLYIGTHNPARVWLPFRMSYVSQEYVISMSADERNCPLGAVVETINGMETGVYLEKTWGEYVGLQTPEVREQQLCYFLMEAGKNGQKLTLELSLPGESRKSRVKWKSNPGSYKQIQWKEYGTPVYTSEAYEVNLLDDRLVWLKFKTQADLAYVDEYFDQIVPLIKDSRGVILDVRNNGGGNSMVGHTILESFAGKTVAYCKEAPDSVKLTSIMSQYRSWTNYEKTVQEGPAMELDRVLKTAMEKIYDSSGEAIKAMIETGGLMYRGRFHLKPEQEKILVQAVWEGKEGMMNQAGAGLYTDQLERSPMIGKPMVLLIGPDSGSATDTMAAEAKAAGFLLVGTRTKGATGMVIRIPAGGEWSAGVSSQRGLTPDGKEINNHGIEASERVEFEAGDLRNGTDRQLERAVELLSHSYF